MEMARIKKILAATSAVATFVLGADAALGQDGGSDPICGPEVVELKIEVPYARVVGPVVLVGGMKEGAKRDVFKKIANAQVEGDGFTAGHTSTSFSVVASAAAEGGHGVLTVTYVVQPQILKKEGKTVKRLVWVADGAPQNRTCSVQLYVPLRAIEKVVVLVEGTALLQLPGKAVAQKIVPATSPKVDVTIVDPKTGKEIAFFGKEAGTATFSLHYRIDTRPYKLPLPVEVLGPGKGEVPAAVEVEVGQSKELRAADLNLKGGAFLPATISDAICDVVAGGETIKVTGRKEGKKRFLLSYQLELEKNGKRTIAAMKIALDVTVTKKAEPPAQPHDR